MADPEPSTARRTRRWRRRGAVVTGAVVVLGAGGYAAYAAVGRPDTQGAYRVVTAATGSVADTLTLTGTVKRVAQVTAAFPVTGTVTGVLVKVGETVTPGQQLATIDQAPLQATVTDAQARLLEAEAQLTADQAAATSPAGGSAASGAASSSTSPAPASGARSAAVSPGTAGKVTMPDPAPMHRAVAAMATAAKDEATVCAPVLSATPAKQPSGPTSTVPSTPTTPPTTPPATSATTPPTTPSARPPRTSPTTSATTPPATSALTPPTMSSTLPPTTSPTTPPTTSPTTPPTTSPTMPPPTGTDVSPQQVASCVAALRTWSSALSGAQGAVTAYAAALGTAQQPPPSATASQSAAPSASRTSAPGSSSSSASSPAAAATREAKVLGDEATVTAAQQALAQAQSDLAGSTLTAPIGGVVGLVGLAPGQAESPSGGITIVGPGAVTVTVPVPLDALPSVKVGQAASVSPPGLGSLTGSVSQVALLPSSTRSTSTVTHDVTVVLADVPQTLATGTYALTTITTAAVANVVTVPVSAIPGMTSGSARLTVMKDGVPTVTSVTVGAVGGGFAEIRSGLSVGETVVIADVGSALPTNSLPNVRGLTGRGGPPGGPGGGTAGITGNRGARTGG